MAVRASKCWAFMGESLPPVASERGDGLSLGSWRATNRDVGYWRATRRASDVVLHLARAVVPPPRLRAKWVVFSAALRTTLGGSGWALARRFGGGSNLRNPARVDVLRNAYKHARAAEISRCLGKKVSFFLKGALGLEGPCLLGLRPNFDGLGWVRLKVSNS